MNKEYYKDIYTKIVMSEIRKPKHDYISTVRCSKCNAYDVTLYKVNGEYLCKECKEKTKCSK